MNLFASSSDVSSADGSSPVVVGLGEILWDLLPEGKQLGGAPANFAYHAKQFGADAYVVSAVGDDALGQEIFGQLDALGIPRDYVSVESGSPTGTVSVELDEKGVPTYAIHEGVAWDAIGLSDALLELAKKTDAVCYGSLAQRCGISRETILSFLRATPEDCLRIFDINLRQHYFDAVTVRDGLALARILKINDEELPVVARLLGLNNGKPRSLEETALDLCGKFDLEMVVLTCGAEGAIRIGPGRVIEHGEGVIERYEGEAVKVVDTVGAGDSFTAAIAAGLLARIEPDRVFRHAARVAGYVCTQAGATPTLPESLRLV